MIRRAYASQTCQSGAGLKLFSDEAISRVHLASLEVLERTGIWVEDDDILDVFADGACRVDRDTHIVKIPPHVVEDALHVTPHTVTICGRDPEKDIVVEGNRVHFESGQFATQTRDLVTGERRPGTKQDSADAARLFDALDNFDLFQSPIVLPMDYAEGQGHGIQAYHAALQNTTKPIHVTQMSSAEADTLIEMAAVVAGGRDSLRDRSPLFGGAFAKSPLEWPKENFAMVLPLARNGLVMQVCSMAMIGASSPASGAGILVLLNAEHLAMITLAQLVERGTRIIYSPLAMSFDMRRGLVASGSPETTLIHCGAAQMAQFYGVPSYGTVMWSDSKVTDAQAGHENTMAAVAAALAGMNLISGSGILECGITYSPAHLVACDEMAGMVKHLLKGTPVSDDTLMIDEIEAVGHGNDYLARQATKAYARAASDPKLIDRRAYEDWLVEGGTDMEARAAAKAKRILEEHEVEPLPEEVLAQIDEIVATWSNKTTA